MFTTSFWRKSLFLGALLQMPLAQSQDLKDELNALDDVPENDFSADSSLPSEAPPSAVAPKSSKAPTTDPLDALPPADEIPPADDLPPTDEAIPQDTASFENDFDQPEGLEKDIEAIQEDPVPEATEALTGVNTEAAGRLTALDFRQLPDRVRLTVKADRSLDFTKESRTRRRQVIVEFKNAALARGLLKRVLDTGEFDGPVALVQAFESRLGNIPTVKILFQLRQFVEPTMSRNGSDLHIDFPILTDATLFRSRSQDQIVLPETFLSANQKMTFTGNKINLNLKDADLADVINLISKASGKNFVLASGTSAKVTLNVKNTPWDQALSIILLNARLGYQKLGGVYRIAPVTELKSEIDQAAEAQRKSEDIIPLETRLFALSYAKAAEVNTSIADFKSLRGKSTAESRTNSLAVTDIPANLEKIARYIKRIDRQTPQVRIEARIVEARKNWSRTFNLDWKIGESGSSGRGMFQDSFANVGSKGNTFQDASSATRLNDVATNTAASGGIRLKVGSLGGWGAVQALLGLAETETLTKTISSPSVTVLDNKAATITQGKTVNVVTPPTADRAETTSQVTVPLTLKVTPQVTSDGYVLMSIDLTANTVAVGTNTPDVRQAQTDLIVQSGKTAVVGGVYSVNKESQERGWPFFRSIPLFGVFFENFRQKTEDLTELLMFISPTILNSEKSLLAGAIENEPVTSSNNSGLENNSLDALPVSDSM